MRVGTRSVLYGAHCFWIHPWFVAAAWAKLFGFPWDWRLWLCFFLHDLGYWGKPNMDGPEGEEHPSWGAGWVAEIVYRYEVRVRGREDDAFLTNWDVSHAWYEFCYYHSRFLAKRDNVPVSRLCYADKLAVALEPWWLYLPRVILSGEVKEYMALAGKGDGGKYATMNIRTRSVLTWHRDMVRYLRAWVEEHKDGRVDGWTPGREVEGDKA